MRELGLPSSEISSVRRQATDDEIRAAFAGKTVEWALGAIAEYRPDGSYEITVMASGSMPARKAERRYSIADGQLCVESSDGRRRCDKIMTTKDGYYMITASGDQYRAKIR